VDFKFLWRFLSRNGFLGKYGFQRRSLLLALNPLTLAMTFLFILLMRSSATSLLGVVVRLIKLIKDLILIRLIVDILGLGSRQDISQLLDMASLELPFLGELDFELDEKVSGTHFVIEERHTVVSDQFGLLVRDDLTGHGGHFDGATIEMGELEGEAGQRL